MLSFLAIASVISCDDDTEELFTTQVKEGFALTSVPNASYLLSFETKDNLAERLTWSPLELTTPVAVTYEVQASANPADFENAAVVTSTSELSTALTVEDLNNLAGSLGLTPFQAGSIAMRVKASLADPAVESEFTEVIVLNVTPYTTESPRLWVPGNYAAASGYGADWAPGDAATPYLEAVEFGSTEYEGFVNMDVASPMFKITLEQDWDEAFGDSGTPGELSLSGGDLSVPGAGFYYITVNTDPDGDGDFSDATWTATPTSWAMIGTATPNDWNDPDTDMTYNATTQKWEVTLMLSQDQFKFRANDDWGTPTNNFGQSSDNPDLLGFNGGDLTFDQAPGMYKVELDLSTPRAYSFTATSI
ncbi:uncharacterized protein DUF5019 [Nonlabens dokdonensis]|uniref:Uncharacterized protein DUF5019 n=3 Tax=Nonlabens dokdonensis TaxID=328515 RepID=A0ABX5Q133_9FLAO|nr:putative lipoprotein [Nonlabens dokdonensis DSW-6]PZX43785.1 uncharacterized protein DUF5019 [Nonlabens dokdonensis]